MEFQELALHVKNARKQKSISQEKICHDLHISRATLSSFENARGDIGTKKVLQILDYLGFTCKIVEKSPFPTLEDLRGE